MEYSINQKVLFTIMGESQVLCGIIKSRRDNCVLKTKRDGEKEEIVEVVYRIQIKENIDGVNIFDVLEENVLLSVKDKSKSMYTDLPWYSDILTPDIDTSV